MVIRNQKSLWTLPAVLLFTLICASGVWADEKEGDIEEDPFEGNPPLADQFREFSNEIALRMHQEMQQLLNKELKALREARSQNRYTQEERIAKQEEVLKKDPQNAAAHFALGEVYDEMRDGANAIIHTQKAEQLFKDQKNLKGLAESRRNLRWFLEKYDYKEGDFLLN